MIDQILKGAVFGFGLGAVVGGLAYLIFKVLLSSHPPYLSMLIAVVIVAPIAFWLRPFLRKVLSK